MKTYSTLIFIIFLLTNCAENRDTIVKKTAQIAMRKGMEEKIYQTKNFKIFTLQRMRNPEEDLRIYIEGDGKAFITKYMPSPDPTPTSYFTINLIAEDSFPNIIYIARPCQYVADKKCEVKYWTSARFSEEVVSSIEEVLREFPDRRIELIGYSGGAAIAKYLAERNFNVVSLRTIAGNVDHQKFTEVHQVSQLDESLDSDKDLDKLQFVPQIHFVGKGDKIIPTIIAKTFAKKMQMRSCVRVVEVAGTTHSEGWKERWKKLLEMEPSCNFVRAG